MGEARRKEERAAKEKAELFEADPEKFLYLPDALFIVLKPNENGAHAVLNDCSTIEEVKSAWFLAEESFQNRRDQLRVMQAKRNHSNIQVVSNMPPLPGSNGGLILQS